MKKQDDKVTVLVTGGSGYIGSHTVKQLIKSNYKVIILDNLSTGKKELTYNGAEFIEGDIGDEDILNDIFNNFNIKAVLHFAGCIDVAESIINPGKYVENNVTKPLKLLEAMANHGCKFIIFSSTAAVYGIPSEIPLKETSDTKPISPYGSTKLFFEDILKYYDDAYGIKSISLRYFNAAGADLDLELGKLNESNDIVSMVIKCALGERDSITIFGSDYDTEDGTCIRDFIHPTDLANAHIIALENLFKNKKTDVFNVGTGEGLSIKQLISITEQVLNKKLNIINGERRKGDIIESIALPEKIKSIGWQPKFSDPITIIRTAYEWELKKRKRNDLKNGGNK